MHAPVSTQALAHLRDASGPVPVLRMSMMPEMTATGSALTPPGPVTGQTSTHLPQRVQASAIASTRADSADSKVMVWGANLRSCSRRWNPGLVHVSHPRRIVGWVERSEGRLRPVFAGYARDPTPRAIVVGSREDARPNLRGRYCRA